MAGIFVILFFILAISIMLTELWLDKDFRKFKIEERLAHK